MNQLNYRCPKCSHGSCEVGEKRAAGGFWSKIYDVQGARYSAVTCERCRYTEFFRAKSAMLGNLVDLFTS